jgi:cobalt transporter subunit CbtB
MFFGLTLVYGVGFAHSHLLHNAAHDVRHSSGFPCH